LATSSCGCAVTAKVVGRTRWIPPHHPCLLEIGTPSAWPSEGWGSLRRCCIQVARASQRSRPRRGAERSSLRWRGRVTLRVASRSGLNGMQVRAYLGGAQRGKGDGRSGRAQVEACGTGAAGGAHKEEDSPRQHAHSAGAHHLPATSPPFYCTFTPRAERTPKPCTRRQHLRKPWCSAPKRT